VSGKAPVSPSPIGTTGATGPDTAANVAGPDVPAAAGRASRRCWKDAGMDSTPHLLIGATITNARPTTLSCGIVPLPGSRMWPRESYDTLR
jgi:hypothetical protein